MFYNSWGLNFNIFTMMNPYSSFRSLRMYCPADRFVMPDSYFGTINPFMANPLMFNPYMMKFNMMQSMVNGMFNSVFNHGCNCKHRVQNAAEFQNTNTTITTEIPVNTLAEDSLSLESRVQSYVENIFNKNYTESSKNIFARKTNVSNTTVTKKKTTPIKTNKLKNNNKKVIKIDNKKIASIVHEKSQKYGVDENLILAMISQESSFNTNATSYKGAKGLMQLMPATARELGVTDVHNPEQNIDAGVRYMKQLLDKYNGNVKLALAAYNAGPGNVQKYGGIPPFEETRNYVRKIYNKYQNASLS